MDQYDGDEDWTEEYKKAASDFAAIIDSIPEEIIQSAYEEGKTIFYRNGKVGHEEIDHE